MEGKGRWKAKEITGRQERRGNVINSSQTCIFPFRQMRSRKPDVP